MKKRLVFFLIGIILFLTSLPISTKMVMELIHNQKMDATYEITNVNQGYPSIESTFHFNNHIISIKETIKNVDSYTDPWRNKVGIADLSLNIDGEEMDTLIDHPIRVDEVGLNRYYGEIAYLILEDKQTSKTQFIAILKKTKELQKEMPNGDVVGWVPPEKLKYTLHAIDEDGSLNNQSFSLSNRNAIQTELLNAGAMAPHSIGYYTDAWGFYPTIFFPFIFPFITLVMGFILILVFFSIRKVNK